MPGKILKVATSVGAVVKNGDLLLILEAMKMENEILAPKAGKIQKIHVKPKDLVMKGDLLFEVE